MQRIDRTFVGGAAPGTEGTTHRWIIDYKTSVPGREGLDEFLDREQERYRHQMEGYAAVMPDAQVCVGLWFPLLGQLRWWPLVARATDENRLLPSSVREEVQT